MLKLSSERESVQKTMVKYAREAGWEYVEREEAARLKGGRTGLLFKETFARQMQKLNSGFINSEIIEELAKKLGKLPARIEGNMQAWQYLRGIRTVFVAKEKREKNVKFVDEDIGKNIFQVTDEFVYTNGTKTNRYDVVFLINGVPVFFVETKAATKAGGIAEALDQIRRYQRETPEAMTLFQIYTLTHILQFYYGTTWITSGKSLLNWKAESSGRNYETLVKTFFDKERVVNTLLHCILFTMKDDKLEKIVLRPHQMRAVKKLVERAESDKKRGLIWHTQGSGKTYTMIVAAQRILENPLFENPTVILLVDRNELEAQLFNNLTAVGFDKSVIEERTAQTKAHLQRLLKNDTRGLIVSMIHKFENIPENMNTRKNIFVLVDEAHRTTSGDLGNFMMGALPNATYIGFTGTPIDKTAYGKGTFKIFGADDPPKGYLDKYGIAESIEDGTTVKLHYTLAPNELRPDRETLEKEFLNLSETEGISDIESLNKVLQKAVNLRNMLKNRERVRKVAEFTAGHFKQNVEPMGYKAFLVGVDREACALYKKELDKLLPKEYSEVVYSAGQNDTEELAKYHLSEKQEKKIRKDFISPDKMPKILIVTEKLLTGFDAPILYCMYLDKPMRDHVLLQAIARVNRPYEDEGGRKKSSGFVLDFVGIFDKLEKALSFDSSDVAGIVSDIDVLKKRFEELITIGKKEYLSITNEKTRDKAIEAVCEHFRNEERRQAFYKFYKEISSIYDILSPDAFLRSHLTDYRDISEMYRLVKEAFEPGMIIDKELSRKTAKLVQEHTKSGHVQPALEIYEINENTLKKLEKSKSSKTEKVFNLLKTIENAVRNESVKRPYLISIGERAEAVSQLFKERQKDTEETLEDLKNLVADMEKSAREQKEKKIPAEVFSAYWILKNEKIEGAEEIANEMNEILEKYPHWKRSEEHERGMRRELYAILSKSRLSPKKSVEIGNNIIRILKEADK